MVLAVVVVLAVVLVIVLARGWRGTMARLAQKGDQGGEQRMNRTR